MVLDTVFCSLLDKFACGDYQPQRSVLHAFSCDIDPTRRRFIKRYHRPLHMFGDALHLSGDTAFCLLTQSMVVVPSVDLCHCGFVCKDISKLNIHRNANRESIIDGFGNTAVTARAFVQYVLNHRPKMLIGENVVELGIAQEVGSSSLSEIETMLRSANYFIETIVARAIEHGSPHDRDRLYIIGIRLDRLASPSTSSLLRETLLATHSATKIGTRPLQHYCLNDNDARLAVWAQSSPVKGYSNKTKWKDDHKKFANEKLGLTDWPIHNYPVVMEAYLNSIIVGNMNRLSDRAHDFLLIKLLETKDTLSTMLADTCEYSIELSQGSP